MSLLPSRSSEVAANQEGEMRVLGINDDEMDAVFDTLSSGTARTILSAIYDSPATASELADRTENSVQTVMYHLDNLNNSGLIQVADTRYSEKGKEMNVYAPADDPVVVFVGTEERKTGLVDMLKRLVGATALLSLISAFLFVFQAFGQPGAAGGGPTILELLSFPGLEFLLGGLFILGLVFLWWIRGR